MSYTDLPLDVHELILHHCKAEVIQKYARKRLFRHTNDPNWIKLLKTVCKHTVTENVDVLQTNFMVRKEWMTEMDSWMDCSEETLNGIVYEVKADMWKNTRQLP